MKWRTEDVVDLEYFLADDAGKDEAQTHERDAKISSEFLPRCLGTHFAGGTDPRAKIRCWLERRREIEWEQSDAIATPGEIFRQSNIALRWLAGVLGCMIGGGLAISIFRWYDDRPINVTWFFAETVLVQLAVLCVILTLMLRPQSAGRARFSIVQSIVAAAFAKLAQISAKAFHQFSGEQRARAHAGLGLLRAKRTIYGSLPLWPVLIVTQIFALGFNAGLLVTILSWVRFSELAFGWSSTLEEPRQDALVQAISSPWAWAPLARPIAEQVKLSRINPAQKAADEDAAARRAWWPFVCYGIACYGFLPRAGLLVWAAWKQRRTLAGIPFNHADSQALLARLGGLAIATGAPGPLLEKAEGIMPHAISANNECIVFVPPEIAAPDAVLGEKVAARLHWQVAQTIRAEIDFLPACVSALDMLSQAASAAREVSSVILIEDWQPPREAYLSFIHAVRERSGAFAHIAVLLIANDGSRSNFAEENARAWRQKLARLGDPYLRVESVADL